MSFFDDNLPPDQQDGVQTFSGPNADTAYRTGDESGASAGAYTAPIGQGQAALTQGPSPTYDQFGYTGGSLLTPYDTTFDPSISGGGSLGNVGNTQAVQTPQAQQFSAQQINAPQNFQYNGPAAPGPLGAAQQVGTPANFSYQPLQTPQNFSYQALQTPSTFNAPTGVNEQNDPGYQFRLQQGIQALQNNQAASGILRTGGAAKALNDYAQNNASNEYANVYNRALQGYQTNTQTQLGAQNQQYQQGANAYQTNAQTQAAAQAQQYGQEYQANQGNFQNQVAAAGANNTANLNTYQAQLAGQGQAFGQGLTSYQANQNAALQAAQFNNQASLGAYQANTGAQAQAAALALQAQQQAYNQNLSTYQQNQGTFYQNQNNQYNKLYGQQGVGQQAANTLGNFGSQYANQAGENITGAGNALASGQIGSANAWNNGLGNIANTATTTGLYYAGLAHPTTALPTGTSSGTLLGLSPNAETPYGSSKVGV